MRRPDIANRERAALARQARAFDAEQQLRDRARGHLLHGEPRPRAGEGGDLGLSPADDRSAGGAAAHHNAGGAARAVALPLTQPFTADSLKVLIEDLKEKAARVRDLPPPSARHPEKFHLERDEIARELAAWATHLEWRL